MKNKYTKEITNSKQKLQQHQEGYIHIPFNWETIGKFFLFVLCLIITIGYFQVLISEWNTHNVGLVFSSDCKLENKYCEGEIGVTQLAIIPHLIFQYIIIGLSILSFFNMFKRKLKSLKAKDVGLIGGLVGGLVIGLAGGLVVGLVFGLVVGLVVGLVGGLIGGLAGGLQNEFNGDDE